MIILASANFDVPLVFVGLFILGVFGVVLYAVTGVLRKLGDEGLKKKAAYRSFGRFWQASSPTSIRRLL